MFFRNHNAITWRFSALFIISFVLMFYDHRSNRTLELRNTLTTLVAPIQFSVSTPVQLIQLAKDNFTTHQRLVSENANLHAQLLLQKAQLQRNLILESENRQLRDLLHSSEAVEGKVKIAQILALSMDPFLSEVILDKGKAYGIYIGQPVLDATGVMGQVIQVGELTSRVMLLTDTRSAVPIQDVRTGIRGIVVGMGPDRSLSMINVAQTSDVRVGDALTSSGLGLRYPAGYPVGRVTSVKNSPGQLFSTVEVEPTAHLGRSRQVLLIWEKSSAVYQEAHEQLDAITKEAREDMTSAQIKQTLGNTNL